MRSSVNDIFYLIQLENNFIHVKFHFNKKHLKQKVMYYRSD